MRSIENLGGSLHNLRKGFAREWAVALFDLVYGHIFRQSGQNEGNRDPGAAHSELASQEPRVCYDPSVVFERLEIFRAHFRLNLQRTLTQDPTAAELARKGLLRRREHDLDQTVGGDEPGLDRGARREIAREHPSVR